MTTPFASTSSVTEACPGCGLLLPPGDGPTHPYIGASSACWGLFGELLAREYGPLGYPLSHRLAVDAYAVQHPGRPEPRSIRSVALHLAGLCLVLEQGVEPRRATRAIRDLLARKPAFAWLEPPRPNGTVTVRDVLSAADFDEHRRRVEQCARDVWEAWSGHHEVVRRWIEA